MNPTIWFSDIQQPTNNASSKHHSRLRTLRSILYGQRPIISSHSEPAGNKEGRMSSFISTCHHILKNNYPSNILWLPTSLQKNDVINISCSGKTYDVACTSKPVLTFAVCLDNGFSRIQHFQLTKSH